MITKTGLKIKEKTPKKNVRHYILSTYTFARQEIIWSFSDVKISELQSIDKILFDRLFCSFSKRFYPEKKNIIKMVDKSAQTRL
jgi:hypothetical protein